MTMTTRKTPSTNSTSWAPERTGPAGVPGRAESSVSRRSEFWGVPPPLKIFVTASPDPRVPAESHRGRLRGMLADLRDVDGLPPKPTAAGPPRPHEGTVPGGGVALCPPRGVPVSTGDVPVPQGHPQDVPSVGSLGISSDVFIMDSIGGGAVSLGDLADLTVTNDNELSCDVSHLPVSPWCPQTHPERPPGSAVPLVSPNPP